jgi:uncharacterized protein
MIDKLEVSSACLSAITEVIRQTGTLYGRVRIQKTAYFLKRLGAAELKHVDFFYHHYGPFSWTVADCLVDGVQCDAIRETPKPLVDDRQAYEYRVSEDLRDKVEEVSPKSRALTERLLRRVKSENWRTLELASTIDYLQNRERISRDAALSRALGLKPACREYQAEALRLLEDLALPALRAPG